jgi:hypothetical protein
VGIPIPRKQFTFALPIDATPIASSIGIKFEIDPVRIKEIGAVRDLMVYKAV